MSLHTDDGRSSLSCKHQDCQRLADCLLLQEEAGKAFRVSGIHFFTRSVTSLAGALRMYGGRIFGN